MWLSRISWNDIPWRWTGWAATAWPGCCHLPGSGEQRPGDGPRGTSGCRGTGWIDDFDSHVLFRGSLVSRPALSQAFNSTLTYSEVPGAAIHFRFKGTEVRYCIRGRTTAAGPRCGSTAAFGRSSTSSPFARAGRRSRPSADWLRATTRLKSAFWPKRTQHPRADSSTSTRLSSPGCLSRLQPENQQVARFSCCIM